MYFLKRFVVDISVFEKQSAVPESTCNHGIMGVTLIPPVMNIMIYPNIWWFYA